MSTTATPTYRVREVNDCARIFGWAVVEASNPNGTPLSQHWNHTDAVLAAEAANAEQSRIAQECEEMQALADAMVAQFQATS